MENLFQYADGTTAFVNAQDSVKDMVIGGVTATSATPRLIQQRIAVLKLTAADTAGAVFAWTPGELIIVHRVILHVKTVATSACTLDIGVAANGTTSAATLITGVDVNAATGVFDNIKNKGGSGLERALVTATQYVTGSKASGAAAGLVGFVYIHYTPTF